MKSKWVESEKGTSANKAEVERRQSNFGSEKYSKFYANQIKNVKELVDANEKDFLLDIGCFTGKFEAIFSHTCKIFGIDISKDALEVANQYCKKHGRQGNYGFFHRNKPLAKMFPGKKFSKAMMLDVTEHIPDAELAKTFAEIKQVLGQDGELIIYTPNKAHWSEWIRAIGIDRREGHINLKKAKELRQFVESNGFSVKELYLKPGTTVLDRLERILPFEFMEKRICLRATLA